MSEPIINKKDRTVYFTPKLRRRDVAKSLCKKMGWDNEKDFWSIMQGPLTIDKMIDINSRIKEN